MKHLLKTIAAVIVIIMPVWGFAQAPDFPRKSVTIVVPWAAGGPPDVVMRALGTRLAAIWGQAVVIENRSGAAGTIGTQYVARSAPDGYTLVAGSLAHTISASFYKKLSFNPQADFVPVTMVAATNYVITVNPAVPVKNVKELLELSKSKPDLLNYSSSGNGSGNHMSMELLKLATGTSFTHVPFKGTGEARNAVVAGDVQIGVDGVSGVVGLVKAGKLRPIAVTGPKRSDVLAEVPTLVESGYSDVVVVPWYGLLAPAATPKDVVAKIAGAVAQVLREPDIVRVLKEQGAEPVGDTPEQFAAFLEKDFARWRTVITATGMYAD